MEPKLTLKHAAIGIVTIEQLFQAGKTNRLMSSENLIDWEFRDSKLADLNGAVQFEDNIGYRWRFYQIRIEPFNSTRSNLSK